MKTALLLLDLQNEMVSPVGKIGAMGLAQQVADRNVLPNTAALLEAARAKAIDIIHVRVAYRPDFADALSVHPRHAPARAAGVCVAGTFGTAFHDAVLPASGELVVTKQSINPFFNTNLLSVLYAREIRHVMLAGVATNLVVEATARYADDAGFHVTIVEDCCASLNDAAHGFTIQHILPLFARVVESKAAASEFGGGA